MFTLWPELLPELRHVVRLVADPLAQAHLAMTCSTEATWRKDWYTSHFSGPRRWRDYAMATVTMRNEAMLLATLTAADVDWPYWARYKLCRRALRFGWDAVVIRWLRGRSMELSFYQRCKLLWTSSSRRYARSLGRVLGAVAGSLARELADIMAFWDFRENQNMTWNGAFRLEVIKWASRHEDMDFISRRLNWPADELVPISKHSSLAFIQQLYAAGLRPYCRHRIYEYSLPVMQLLVQHEHRLDPRDVASAGLDAAIWAVSRGMITVEQIQEDMPCRRESAKHAIDLVEYFRLPPARVLGLALNNRDYCAVIWCIKNLARFHDDPPAYTPEIENGNLRDELIKNGWLRQESQEWYLWNQELDRKIHVTLTKSDA